MKKNTRNYLLLSIVALFISNTAYAQINKDDDIGIDIRELQEHRAIVEEAFFEEKVFAAVEQMPVFKGGEKAMFEFIKANLKHPPLAVENGIEGRVVIKFVITKEGKITNTKIIRGIDTLCDREALRVVNSMPDWVPGKQNNWAVPVYFTLPILFKLPKDDYEGVKDTIYQTVDEKAIFPGPGSISDFLNENYDDLEDIEYKGTIKVTFVVEKDGSLSNLRTIRSIDPRFDNIFVKAIKSMPKWIPGKKDGITVRSRQELSVSVQKKEEKSINKEE